jgi:uncharacterized protein HemY
MKLSLRILAACILVPALFFGGVATWRTFDATAREATSSNLLIGARTALEKGNRSEAIFMSGSAAALNPSAFVLLAAGDVLIDANERSLARDILVRALTEASSNDPKLELAVKAALDRAAQNEGHKS